VWRRVAAVKHPWELEAGGAAPRGASDAALGAAQVGRGFQGCVSGALWGGGVGVVLW